MTTATMAAKLTAAGVRYVTHNYDGGCVVLSVPPRQEWDRPVEFYCVAGQVRCEYRGTKSIAVGIGLAVLGGVRV